MYARFSCTWYVSLVLIVQTVREEISKKRFGEIRFFTGDVATVL